MTPHMIHTALEEEEVAHFGEIVTNSHAQAGIHVDFIDGSLQIEMIFARSIDGNRCGRSLELWGSWRWLMPVRKG